MKIRLFVLLLLSVALSSHTTRKALVESCDVVRTEYATNEDVIPLYQGNGRFGGLVSSSGLQMNPLEKSPYVKRNALYSFKRSIRAKFNGDELVPVTRIYWKEVLDGVERYNQHQHYYEGTVSTSFTDKTGAVEVLSWFDADRRDLAFFRISSTSAREIIIDTETELSTHYGMSVHQDVDIERIGGSWKITATSRDREFCFFVESGFDGRVENGKLVLTAIEDSYICISCLKGCDTTPSASLHRTRRFWKDKWESMAFVDFGKAEEQKVFVRGAAQILSSFNDDGIALAPPMGFTGNSWPFSFPQDISYIQPNLLMLGQKDEARAIIEYFAGLIGGLKEYTARLVNAEGIFCPWTMPYSSMEGFHTPGPPNIFYYETHNSGYLCRMAYETSLLMDDRQWTEKYAYPLIEGCAAFYKSISYKGEDGYWHVRMTPGMGQDEAGGYNMADYLCSMYSAAYCFEKAVECGLDTDGSLAAILRDSLAFRTIKSPDGYYYCNLGSGPQDYGKQKHPVQLNSLAYLPLKDGAGPEELHAYTHRYEITKDAAEPYFYGWSLGTFLLASSRVQDRAGWQKDWDNILASDYADADYLQFYETSSCHDRAYYITTTGLMMQSLLCNLVNDWKGEVRIAACVPASWTSPVRVEDVWSNTGIKVSGTIYGQKDYSVVLEAWKDCDVVVDGLELSLKKGRKYRLESCR